MTLRLKIQTESLVVLLRIPRGDTAECGNVTAMLQARDAVDRRSWSHPQEPTGEEWWADVLADPRARKRQRRTDLAVKQAFYRLPDERRGTILVACSKCEWRAAFSRDDLIASHGAAVAPRLERSRRAPALWRRREVQFDRLTAGTRARLGGEFSGAGLKDQRRDRR